MDVLMKCGHTANAVQKMRDGTEKPCCVICMCSEVAEAKPDLTGRKAKCCYYGKTVSKRNNETHYPELMKNGCCGSIVDSKYSLPFFKRNPDREYDEFYCGCQSWD